MKDPIWISGALRTFAVKGDSLTANLAWTCL
jgi:hypothetical protein